MDTFEINKILGAILGAALLLIVINEIGNILVHPTELEKSVLGIEVASGEAHAATQPAAAMVESALALLAAADADKGLKVAKKCATCHTFDDGGAKKIGPNLWSVLGRAKASISGYSYSKALTGLGGEWSYEDMDAFLTKPKEFAPGTKMTFAGIKKATDRANLLAYLRQQHSAPPPLPAQ